MQAACCRYSEQIPDILTSLIKYRPHAGFLDAAEDWHPAKATSYRGV